jgi:YggT family protein
MFDSPYLPPLPLPGVPHLPGPFLSWAVQIVIGAIMLAMLIRAIASWFQMDERFAFIRFLAHITDPFVSPFRRIIRGAGIFDFSWIVAFFMLSILQILILQSITSLNW